MTIKKKLFLVYIALLNEEVHNKICDVGPDFLNAQDQVQNVEIC